MSLSNCSLFSLVCVKEVLKCTLLRTVTVPRVLHIRHRGEQSPYSYTDVYTYRQILSDTPHVYSPPFVTHRVVEPSPFIFRKQLLLRTSHLSTVCHVRKIHMFGWFHWFNPRGKRDQVRRILNKRDLLSLTFSLSCVPSFPQVYKVYDLWTHVTYGSIDRNWSYFFPPPPHAKVTTSFPKGSYSRKGLLYI